ncbi:MAG: HAD family hydrolase [Candidatus Aenigmatarchaeota archaeon]
MIRAVLFDLDNTLIDFMRMKRICTEEAVSGMIAAGLPMGKEKAVKTLFEMYRKHGIEDQTIFQKFLQKTQGRIDYKVLAEGINCYRRVKAGFTEPYPKVISTLLRLRNMDLKLGVVSDAPRLQAWLRLAAMRLTEFFEFVITTDDVGGKLKPDEMPFQAALEKLGVPPGEILFVGDNPERDIAGAKKAGMRTALARYAYSGPVKVKPDFELASVADILKIVGAK